MYKRLLIAVACMLAAGQVLAQWRPVSEVDTAQWYRAAMEDTSRWDFHLSTGSMVATGWGKTDALVWVAPRVGYQVNDRLWVGGGFAAAGSLLGGYQVTGLWNQSLAPRRQGTQVMAARAEAEYRVGDHLTVWASLAYAGGWFEPLWAPRGEALSLGLTALSGGFAYETDNHTFFEMHFHIVHDQYGNAAHGLWGHPWYGPGVPGLTP